MLRMTRCRSEAPDDHAISALPLPIPRSGPRPRPRPTRATGFPCATMWSRSISAPSRRNAATRQRLRFNVVVEVRPRPQPLEDDVDRILSYDRITEAIAAELAAERLNLLETLAERVAERILAEPQAMRVFVRIEKLDRRPLRAGGGDRAQSAPRCRCGAGQRRGRGACIRWWSFWTMPRLPRPTCPARLDALQAQGAAGDPDGGPARPAAPADRPQADPAPDRPAGDRAERLGAGRPRSALRGGGDAGPRSTGR